MQYIIFILAVIFFCFSAFICYNNEVRNSKYFIFLGLILGNLTSFLWFYLAKMLQEKEKIYFASVIWDVLLFLVFILIPIFFFEVKLNKYCILGLTMIVLGLLLFKFNFKI